MNIKIGIGKYDVTGPCAEVGFLGYFDFGQKGAGIQSRLFSRAFVIEDLENEQKCTAIVCADLAFCTQAVHQAVIKKLADRFGDLFTEKNVLITGNHTHSGPGGYSHYFTYNASMLGFHKQNFNCIVDGIYQSIVAAHENKTPGNLTIAEGFLENCGRLRSKPAYEHNFPVDIGSDNSDVMRTMTLLKCVDESGNPIGSINWFAVHPTNMGQKNKLVSGDNKGYAEELMEQETGLVSAFANECCGDISPNINGGPPDGIHDFERMQAYGRLQFEKAKELFNDPGQELTGPVDYRQTYVDMSCCPIEGGSLRTWPAAMGLGMTPGSSEDSEGVPIWPEGTTREDFEEDPDKLRQALGMILPGILAPRDLDQEFVEGHGKKPILAPLGLMKIKGAPFVPSVLPLQLIRIGSLVLIAHPGEMTTIAGRRMREDILEVFEGAGVSHAVVAAYAGAYSSYTTTEREYAMQHYEGASTLFGPWTHMAYKQENRKLAKAMMQGNTVPPGPQPEDYSGKLAVSHSRVLFDCKPLWRKYGEVLMQPESTLSPGETAAVKFQGAHPANNLRTMDTYLRVEKLQAGDWDTVYTDSDTCTSFIWKRLRFASSVVTIEWMIPEDQAPGTYRIRYFGERKRLLGFPRIKSFSGTSKVFEVG